VTNQRPKKEEEEEEEEEDNQRTPTHRRKEGRKKPASALSLLGRRTNDRGGAAESRSVRATHPAVPRLQYNYWSAAAKVAHYFCTGLLHPTPLPFRMHKEEDEAEQNPSPSRRFKLF